MSSLDFITMGACELRTILIFNGVSSKFIIFTQRLLNWF